MSPDSQFGFDKYTFTSFETPSDKDWNSLPSERFVYLPASKYFALPNAKGEETVEWMEKPINELVKSSSEYKQDNKFNYLKKILFNINLVRIYFYNHLHLL